MNSASALLGCARRARADGLDQEGYQGLSAQQSSGRLGTVGFHNALAGLALGVEGFE